MARVELSPEAYADVEEIEFQGALQFGLTQAAKYQSEMLRLFDLLGHFPLMGSPLRSARHPGWRRFAYGAHVIVYSTSGQDVLIQRVLHGRSDLFRHI